MTIRPFSKSRANPRASIANRNLRMSYKLICGKFQIEASDYRDGYIPIHLKPYKRITVSHRTANPATDYKYFYLHRPTQSFGHVVYGPHTAQYFWDVLERSEQPFSA